MTTNKEKEGYGLKKRGCYDKGRKKQKSPAAKTRGLFTVGVRGFEPPASSSRTKRANRAAPHPGKIQAAKLKNHIFFTNFYRYIFVFLQLSKIQYHKNHP